MKYISGIYALNLRCSLDTDGDWHQSSLDWEKPEYRETDGSLFGLYGIEETCYVPENPGVHRVAHHLRAVLDLLSEGRFHHITGLKDELICNDSYTDELFSHVALLVNSDRWESINKFMKKEYREEWVNYVRKL